MRIIVFATFILLFLISISLFSLSAPSKNYKTTNSNVNTNNVNIGTNNIKYILEKAKKIEGVFNIYSYKDKYYLEIPKSKLNYDYFVTLQIAKGNSIYPFLGGLTWPPFNIYGDDTENVYFYSDIPKDIQNGDIVNVYLYNKNLKYRSSMDDASSNLVKKSFTDSVVLKINGIYYDEKIFISLDDFTQKIDLVLNSMSKDFRGISVQFDELKKVKNYPNNMILYISYLLSYQNPLLSNYLGSTKNNQIIVALNIFDYKDDGYKPRVYDYRVGYFSTNYNEVSSIQNKDNPNSLDRPMKRYINRWNLENNRKITIWIENTWPEQYRETVKEAILEWNKAFNKIGYDNPIEVKIQPYDSDWEPEDIRYSTVRYQDSNLTPFAIGPSIALPTTGEIIDADVVFYAPMLRILSLRFDNYYDLIINSSINSFFDFDKYLYIIDKDKGKLISNILGDIKLLDLYGQNNHNKQDNHNCHLHNEDLYKNDHLCTYPSEKTQLSLVSLFSMMISDQSYYNLTKDKFLKDYLKDIVIHEIGHILGLRHNFKASSFVSIDQLQDSSYTAVNGISYSAMDYNPPNVHFKNGRPYFPKDVFMTNIGKYDYIAIEYGYTKDESKLKQIAYESGKYYGPDEDIYLLNPLVRRFDLSSEPYKIDESFFNIYKYVLDNAPYKLNIDNPGFIYLSTVGAFSSSLINRSNSLLYYMYGKYVDRSDNPILKMIDPKVREKVIDLVIKDIVSEKPIVNKDSLSKAVMFGSYEWGSQYPISQTLLDKAYIIERAYKVNSMFSLIVPLSLTSGFEYYYDQDIHSKNIRKLYNALFSSINLNKDISKMKQQQIEDFISILLLLNYYDKSQNPLIYNLRLNMLLLPSVRNEAFNTLEKIEKKLKTISESNLSTYNNKIFAKRMLYLIENIKDD